MRKVAALNGQPSVSLFVVLDKFYDNVCLHKLSGLAQERSFRKRLLYIAMQAYLSNRTFREENWWRKACSLPTETWQAALWETDMRGWYCTTFWSA